MSYLYHSISDLLRLSADNELPLWKVILEKDFEERKGTREESFEMMRSMYIAMREADRDYDGSLTSISGMVGGDGALMQEYNKSGKNLMGDYVGLAMEKAVKMGESNACMKRIVAAPTAGSCGVIPAVFLAYEELFCEDEDRMVEALYISAGIGEVIALNASISGAEGGCQAEIGSAAAMAAAGLAYLQGGDNEQIVNAMTFAIKNMLGLACDPVGGLVEVPCVKRNSAGAVNAIASAQMAMAGLKSAIPADEVIDAMRRVGCDLPTGLRETGEGGLATTRTAMCRGCR